MNSRKLGFEIHIVDLLLRRMADASEEVCCEQQLTGTHGFILGYLSRHTDRPVYQRDIERHFGMRRSSVSTVLTLMEHNGLIERQPVSDDARLKRIVMTDKGRKLHAGSINAFERIDAQALEGVTEAQLNTFYEVLNAIQHNLGYNCCDN